MAGETLAAVEGIVFDLDDTLLSKADWTIPALEFAAGKLGLEPQKAWELATQYVAAHGAADAGIYNHILCMCGQSDSALNIRALVAWANQYAPAPGSLSLVPGAKEALASLSRSYRLAVIADGPVASQQSKVRATRLDRLVAAVVYSDAIDGVRSRKPDARPFRLALAELGTRSTHTLFVGDNPAKDFKRPRMMGMLTVRVRSGEYANVEYPSDEHVADYEISSVARLPGLLIDAAGPKLRLGSPRSTGNDAATAGSARRGE
jgi:putative hydrolase of the HAD superfamily